MTQNYYIFILDFEYVCFCRFYVPLENCSPISRHHHYQWRASNFDLYSALMAIKHWEFFSVPHLARNGASVYNGNLRGSVTCCWAFGSGAVTTFFYDLGVSWLGFVHLTVCFRGQCSTPLCHRGSPWLCEFKVIRRKGEVDIYHKVDCVRVYQYQISFHNYSFFKIDTNLLYRSILQIFYVYSNIPHDFFL